VEEGEEGVVEVVRPLGVHAIATGFAGGDDAGIVEVGLGDEEEAPADGGGEVFDFCGELLHEMDGGAVDELMHGVEAEAIDVEVAHPHEGVVAEEAADLVGAGVLEVDGVTPGGVVLAGEIGAELAGVVADRAEVVIDDVEDDAEAVAVAGVDEALEGVRAAVVPGGGEDVDAVITPAAIAGPLRDGHEFQVGDAEVREVGQALNGGVEGASLGEGADVELVDDGATEGRSLPGFILPLVGVLIVELRGRVDAVGLGHAARIGIGGGIVVDEEGVLVVPGGVLDADLPDALAGGSFHGIDFLGFVLPELEGDFFGAWGPDFELVHRFVLLYQRGYGFRTMIAGIKRNKGCWR
jgi:hypothetical protein